MISSEGDRIQSHRTIQSSLICFTYSPGSRALKEAVLTTRNLAFPMSYDLSLQLLHILPPPVEISFPPKSFPGCLINEGRYRSPFSSHSVIIITCILTVCLLAGLLNPKLSTLESWAVSWSPMCPKSLGLWVGTA